MRLTGLPTTMTIGLTGGIAAGKSTVCEFLAARLKVRVFDADDCVHQLLSADPEVGSDVACLFGKTILGSDGFPDRSALRALVFTDAGARRRLEAILHPLVRQRWMALREHCLHSGDTLLADIPLLYETSAQQFFDHVIVVACSPDTQRKRLEDRDVPPGTAESMLASQLPVMQKVALASFVVWNDGSKASLRRQTELLADQIFQP